MSDEQNNCPEFFQSVLENMAWGLIRLATDDDGNKHLMTRDANGLKHLRILNSAKEIEFQVSAESIDGLGWEMVLACLHKISIEKLKKLHKTPLRRTLQAV